MKLERLDNLMVAYRNAPEEYYVTQYWSEYQKIMSKEIYGININQMRSGKYPILATFGFNDVIYSYSMSTPWFKKLIMKFFRGIVKNRNVLPYGLNLTDIREMAFHHCQLLGELNGAKSIDSIEMSTFGQPSDLFKINNKFYSMQFLNFYLRYCFATKYVKFSGEETIAELGSGSGHQIEVLKKLYPDQTVLCFDLPVPIFLCETYLSEVFGKENIVSTEETLGWNDLKNIQKGKIHFFGNWQMPLLENFNYDLFWNAASFGEMEPGVVMNYLKYVQEKARLIYLLQARQGKESRGRIHVNKQTKFGDYNDMLSAYKLINQEDAYFAHKRMSQSGGYFQAIWEYKN
ncbi:putative sugar O-methyltransferase [candidate division KSB1 bacterium]|nr:putative sugar O-methyltransferase [candidate division KSB1 bacterium]